MSIAAACFSIYAYQELKKQLENIEELRFIFTSPRFQCEKVKWLQNMNPEVPGLIYKLAPLDDKMRKLSHVRKLWDGILDIHSINDVFTGQEIDKCKYDVDHFIPWSFVMNDELWNLMPMDSNLNSSKSNRLPVWDDFFESFARNQYIMYDLIHERDGIRNLYEA